MRNERLLIRMRLNAAEFTPWIDYLVSPDLEAECCSSKASMVSECGNSAPALVLEEFEIKKGPPSPGKAAKDSLPAALVLENVKEGDMCVLEGKVFVGEFFEPDDDVVGWGVDPGAFWYERESEGFVFLVVEDPLLAALYSDIVACVLEKLCRSGSQSTSVLERFSLSTEVEDWARRHVWMRVPSVSPVDDINVSGRCLNCAVYSTIQRRAD